MMKTMFGLAVCARAARTKPRPARAREPAAVAWTKELVSVSAWMRARGRFRGIGPDAADGIGDGIPDKRFPILERLKERRQRLAGLRAHLSQGAGRRAARHHIGVPQHFHPIFEAFTHAS